MRIGVDIDGVLTDVWQFAVNHFSKYLVENNIEYEVGESNYLISKTFGVDESVEDDFWEKWLEFYSINEPARPFASEVIKRLKEDDNEIYIVTARWTSDRDDEVGEKMRNIVRNWLKENDIIYDKLVFTRGKNKEKLQEVRDDELDLIIEDNPNNIKQLSTIVPVICYDTDYNRDCRGENIYRCYSWYDVYREITDRNKVERVK
jgi:uncharacterized HAD superfamily protein